MINLKPSEIASAFIDSSVKKSKISKLKMLGLGFMAGIFIAFASAASNIAAATVRNPSLSRFMSASVFPVGLLLVLIAGGELFTGNSLMIISFLEKKISFLEMLKNWFFVYIGNFIGSLFVAVLIIFGGQMDLFGGEVLTQTLNVANYKCSLSFIQAIFLGILCNMLVCLAVWISAATNKSSGKLILIYIPVFLVVLCAFEHSIANMYYISAALLSKLKYDIDLSVITYITVKNFFLSNLLPVSIGNILGGGLIGAIYHMIYLK